MNWFDYIKEHLFILIVGFIIGIMFLLKGYEKTEINNKKQLVRYVIHGVLISMFITWLGFEIFHYLGLPYKLCVALGGGCAYLGTDYFTTILEKFIQKKIG
ncbi:phage holin family protein [uncultured Helicobacter sp.]|uniref:phage holin family protein n=1 Tax=uncultured Helicobacter sp. TaxID=175537 RepID=UPI00374F760E